VPRNPEAWLLTTARHSLIDFIRHQQVVLAGEPLRLDAVLEAIYAAFGIGSDDMARVDQHG
jgi:predicted RNA polymerase sigma factor